MEIEMRIKGLVVDPISKMPIVVLEDPQTDRILPIWIGVFEANAIALTIENIPTPRPMTHDLLKSFLEKLEVAVEKIVVNDVRNNTFYALIHCRHKDQPMRDRFPPLRRHRPRPPHQLPIFVEDNVVQKAQSLKFDENPEDSEKLMSNGSRTSARGLRKI